MEQSWTNDRYDIPYGDLEFWAQRRGKMPVAVNNNLRPRLSAQPTTVAQLALVACLAIALGFAMQGLVLAGKLSIGDRPAVMQVLVDLAQGITWSFVVCAGVGLGMTIARAHKALGGLLGFIVAPIAMGIATGSQKVMVSALGAVDEPVILSLPTLGLLRAIEYGLLGWALAWLATKQETPLRRFVLAGAAVGLALGGGITALTFHVANGEGIVLTMPQIIGTSINEIVFPIGCAVVVYVALQVGRQIKLVLDKG